MAQQSGDFANDNEIKKSNKKINLNFNTITKLKSDLGLPKEDSFLITSFDEKSYVMKDKFIESKLGEENEFIYKQYQVKLEDFPKLLNKKPILNNAYSKELNGKQLKRQAKELFGYKSDKTNFVILDIDDVTNPCVKDYLQYIFMDMDYVAFPSKSYGKMKNGKLVYNIKVLLRVDLDNEPIVLKEFIKMIKKEAEQTSGKLDTKSIAFGSYQAPMEFDDFEWVYVNKGNKILSLREEDLQEFLLQQNRENTSRYEPEFYKNLDKNDTTQILNAVLDVIQKEGFTVTSMDNTYIKLSHPTEVKSKNGYWVNINSPFYINHHGSKGYSIFRQVMEYDVAKSILAEYEERKRKEILANNYTVNDRTKYYKINKRYIDIDEKTYEMNKHFVMSENARYLIKSPMGTGKSKIIDDILNKTFMVNPNAKVILVSNRKSIADDMYSKYGEKFGISHYKDVKFEFNAYDDLSNTSKKYKDSVIVQYDSLYKIDVNAYDLVIMDEFMSLLFHTRSNLHSSHLNEANKYGFFRLLKNSKSVLSDALLKDIKGLQKFFTEETINNTFMIENEYRDNNDLIEYDNKLDFNSEINNDIRKMADLKNQNKPYEKIVIATTVKSFGLFVLEEAKHNGLRVAVMSAESDDTYSDLVTKSFSNENQDVWDILIYTPSITTGISILDKNVGKVYYFDTSNSADVFSSLQMIKRVRKDDVPIHFYIQNIVKNMPTDKQRLIESVLYKPTNNGSDIFEFDYYGGEIKYKPSFDVYSEIEVVYNLLENKHKKSFEDLLKEQFSKTPVKFNGKYSDTDIEMFEKEYKQELKQIKERKIEEMKELILNTRDFYSDGFVLLDDSRNAIYEKSDVGINPALRFIGKVTNDFIEYMNVEEITKLALMVNRKKSVLNKIKTYAMLDVKTSIFEIESYIKERARDFDITFKKYKKDYEMIIDFKNLINKGIVVLDDVMSKKTVKKIKDNHFKDITKMLKRAGYNRDEKTGAYVLNQNIKQLSSKLENKRLNYNQTF